MIRKALAALVVVLALAAPARADFVLNGTSLTTNKQDLFPTPIGANPLNYITAADYNAVSQAAIDLRSAITGVTGGFVLKLGDGSAAGVSATGTGALRYNNTTHVFEQSLNGGAWAAFGGGGGGTQGGTTSASHVPYASGANTLADGELAFNSATHTYSIAATTILDWSATTALVKFGAGISSAAGDLPFAFGGSATPHMTMSDLGGVYALYFGPKTSNDYIYGGGNQLVFRTNSSNAMSLTQNQAVISGGLCLHRNAQSGTSYTINSADVWVMLSNTAARAVALPAASSFQAGQIVVIKDIAGTAGTGNITISRAGADLIDGATTLVISTNYGKAGLVSDGASVWSQVF